WPPMRGILAMKLCVLELKRGSPTRCGTPIRNARAQCFAKRGTPPKLRMLTAAEKCKRKCSNKEQRMETPQSLAHLTYATKSCVWRRNEIMLSEKSSSLNSK